MHWRRGDGRESFEGDVCRMCARRESETQTHALAQCAGPGRLVFLYIIRAYTGRFSANTRCL